jgi:hypothetical protein
MAYSHREEDAPKTVRIKCTHAFGSDVPMIGKVFVVMESRWKSEYNYLTILGRGVYPRDWFELVSDCPPTQPSIPKASKVDPNIDPEEERLWKLMRPRLDPGHCDCGIFRGDCKFHR